MTPEGIFPFPALLPHAPSPSSLSDRAEKGKVPSSALKGPQKNAFSRLEGQYTAKNGTKKEDFPEKRGYISGAVQHEKDK